MVEESTEHAVTAAAPQPENTVTVDPLVDFEAYPFGEPVQFKTGVESQPIPESYAQMLRGKKLVAE